MNSDPSISMSTEAGHKVTLNTYCLERIVRFCLEPLFSEDLYEDAPDANDGRAVEERDTEGPTRSNHGQGEGMLVAPASKVAQPRLAALMRVSKQMNKWASRLLYRHISLDVESLVTSLFGDITPILLQSLIEDGGDDDDKVHSGHLNGSGERGRPTQADGRIKTTARYELQQQRLAQLGSIETMHLDMEIYIDEEDDPDDWQPLALQQILSSYDKLRTGHMARLATSLDLPGGNNSTDPQSTSPFRSLPQRPKCLPQLKAINLFRADAVWRMEWPAKVLRVLSLLSDIRVVCHSSYLQVPITENELAALCSEPSDATTTPEHPTGGSATNIAGTNTSEVNPGATILRHHDAALHAIRDAKAPGTIIIDLNPTRIFAQYQRAAFRLNCQIWLMRELMIFDHTPRNTLDESDVSQRSIWIYGLDRAFRGGQPLVERPTHRASGLSKMGAADEVGDKDQVQEQDEEENEKRWKRRVLREVEIMVREKLQLGWYHQWIRHDKIFVRMASDAPACEVCGRRG